MGWMQGSRLGQRVAGVALAAIVTVVAFLLGGGPGPRAQTGGQRVRYVFQPDCYRPSLGAPCDQRRTGMVLDLGPQIAVWVESADRSRFVDTLMVTNVTALRGIGNRPGHWRLPSSPKFPYGKRLMALPVWAFARGHAYQPVVMQDGPDRELWLGFHEVISSPDPYFCRPMTLSEIDVDAVSCPTAVFNSAKGKLSGSDPAVYYPPRNDLRTFTDRDCDVPNASVASCPLSARQYAELNDLDAVAAATPAYGRPFEGVWNVPADLPDGEYALLLEISKEFDNNAVHAYEALTDPALADSGLKNNIGQPSVVFRVPLRLDRAGGFQAAAQDITGYGAWDGSSGVLHPPDESISDAPGSGRGRLLPIAVAGGPVARLHVVTEVPGAAPDAGVDSAVARDSGDGGEAGARCAGQTIARVGELMVPAEEIDAEQAVARFVEPDGAAFAGIERYDVRVWEGGDSTPAAFASGTPSERLVPLAAGTGLSVHLTDLKGQRKYTVGVKPVGPCLDGQISYAVFVTAARKFSQLSGCFIATAAHGSAQAPAVAALRRARDSARRATAIAAAAAALYERASPPLADLLRGTAAGRALVRQALAPVVDVAMLLTSP
jgi:hypothetical protein